MANAKHGDLQPIQVGGQEKPQDRSKWLKLGDSNFQYFNDGDTPPADPPAGGDTPPADPPVDDKTPPVDDKPAGSDKKDTKTFTQDDVSAIASKEAKKERERILKSLGIEDVDNAKDGMKAFKEWQESQKTEAQKQADQLEALQKTNLSAEQEKAQLRAEVSALKNKVKPESVADVIVLANNLVTEDVDIDAAMKSVIEKYPHFKDVVEADDKETKKPKFATGNHDTTPPTEAAKWLDAFK